MYFRLGKYAKIRKHKSKHNFFSDFEKRTSERIRPDDFYGKNVLTGGIDGGPERKSWQGYTITDEIPWDVIKNGNIFKYR